MTCYGFVLVFLVSALVSAGFTALWLAILRKW